MNKLQSLHKIQNVQRGDYFMIDEERTVETGNKVEDNTNDYLAAIKELKQNSVDRSEYDRLKAENKKLIDAVVNGQVAQETQQAVVHTRDEINALRHELFDPEHDLSNLEYVTKAIELREALIENGEPDPFIPVGKQISPSRDDIEIAEKCAQVYKECIEFANGDSEVFTNELMRRTKDVRIR